MASAKRPDLEFCELDIRVTPRSSRNKVSFDTQWRAWVTAPPVDGQANAAMIGLLAETFGVAKSSVLLIRGDSSRDKRFRITGLTENECLAKVGAAKLFD